VRRARRSGQPRWASRTGPCGRGNPGSCEWRHNGGSMGAKPMRLRYAGTCAGCGLGLPVGTKAWWDAEARSTTCCDCQAAEDGHSAHADHLEQGLQEPFPEAVTARPADQAGASARQEYERRHQRREQRLDQRWGQLAGVAKFVSDDPQSTKAWAKGSEGERRLAAHLVAAVGDRAVLLHDRKVPKTRRNIDHMVIAASGIWVIDAKHYTGMVEQRDVGGWFKIDRRLYVGGRDRTKIAEGLDGR
jgi:hypothetical protein